MQLWQRKKVTSSLIQNMKKKKWNWKIVAAMVAVVSILTVMLLMYERMEELTNQLAYLQDTTNIILSDVGGMQSNIEKTLEEEASMVESYSIDIVDMDLSKHNYKVDIAVIPKEYTDSTRVSIYFGTTECPLVLDGYVYKGSITLPLDKTFEGNVTFLLANGKKKATEVLEDYNGLRMDLDQVLSGKIEAAPTYKDGSLHLKTNCEFTLDGVGRYEFDSLELVAQLDEEEIWTQNLLEDLENPSDSPQDKSGLAEQMADTQLPEESENDLLPVSGHSGNVFCKFSYKMDTQEGLAEEDRHIRIFLRAVTVNGYQFEYDVFQGDYLIADEKLDKENFDWNSHSVVYDDKGGKMDLE